MLSGGSHHWKRRGERERDAEADGGGDQAARTGFHILTSLGFNSNFFKQLSSICVCHLDLQPQGTSTGEETSVHIIGPFYSTQSAQRRIRAMVAGPPGGPPHPHPGPPSPQWRGIQHLADTTSLLRRRAADTLVDAEESHIETS